MSIWSQINLGSRNRSKISVSGSLVRRRNADAVLHEPKEPLSFLTAVQLRKFWAVYPVMCKRGFGHIEGVCSGFYGRKVGATQCERCGGSDALILPTGARS
jgi:hypothetical protein